MSRGVIAEKSIKRAALINFGSKYVALAIQLVYTALLSRMLSPEDFGVVAIAQVFVLFFNIFADMGLGAAIIQKQNLNRIDYARLFGFTGVIAVIMGLMLCALGPVLAVVYGEGALVPVCQVLSVSLLLTTLNTVPNALLMKSKRFLSVGIRQIVVALVASLVGLASAICGAGLFSIAIYSVANSLFVFIWNIYTTKVPIKLRGMRDSVGKVFGYSAYVFAFDIVNYFSRNLDNLLVGFFFGSASLGNYSKAYQLMRYPQIYLTSVVTPVLHPMLAERQDDLDCIYTVFLKTFKMLSLVGVFVSTSCFFLADDIVNILYGAQWGGVVPCFRLLAISLWSQMVCGTAGTMFQVLNRTKEQFVRGLLIAAVIVASILAGTALGSIEAVAGCVGIAYYFAFFTFILFLVKGAFQKTARSFFKVLIPDAFLAIAMSIVFHILSVAPLPGGAIGRVFISMFIGGITFMLLLVATNQLKWFSSILPGRLKKVALRRN